MEKINELEYEVKQLKFEKENLRRQLVAAMKLNKKMYEKEVELNTLITSLNNALLKKQND